MTHLLDEHPGASSVDAPSRYSREIELLLCCRGGNGDSKADEIRRLLEQGVDWNRLLTLARWHKLLPLLCLNLTRLESRLVPAEVSSVIDRLFRMNAGRSLAMVGELLTIVELLDKRGVAAVPYKGPALAERLYGNVALRESSDLDLIVEREQVTVARRILLDRGYLSSVRLDGANRRFLLDSRYSERFDREDGIVVELHWAFTNKDVAFPITLRELRPRLDELWLGGKKIQVFSREDLLLILCVHGAKHLWNRLEWILGVAGLTEEGIDWDRLLSRARTSRSERMLLLGLALARDVYGVSYPEKVRLRVDSDGSVQELAGEVRRALQAEEMIAERDEEENLKYDVFHYRLGDDLRSRVRYLFYRLTTPSRPDDWSSISIGDRWMPLHAFVRPFRLATKFVALLGSRASNSFLGKPGSGSAR